ncbi:hypothetical protein VNI00_016807 [Paramarasmius palmivorus]|uniref:Uncharacterized protein n=1 Tax=Paramarasmius palmivorus TaxID=297713 RepID=A0AAW0BAX8_9AGAR
MVTPLSPSSSGPPVLSSSDEEEILCPPILVPSDNEGEWLRSPTKTSKRRFQGRRTGEVRKKTKTTDTVFNSSDVIGQVGGSGISAISGPSQGSTVEPVITGAQEASVQQLLVPGVSHEPTPEKDDENFERYVRMMDSGCLGYERIGRYLYVVQGWDRFKEEGQVRVKSYFIMHPLMAWVCRRTGIIWKRVWWGTKYACLAFVQRERPIRVPAFTRSSTLSFEKVTLDHASTCGIGVRIFQFEQNNC